MNLKALLPPRLYRGLASLRMALTRETIYVGAAGARYHINRYSYVERLIANNEFETERARFVCKQIRPKDIFIDIGANIGFFSILAARLGAEVWAFEPEPNNLKRLRRNIELNGFTAEQVTVFNFALGNESGEVCLYRPLTDNYGRSAIGLSEATDSVTVPIRRLDEVLKPTNTRCVVKVDVEGAELQVFGGGDSVIANMSAGSLWLVEVHVGAGVDTNAVAERFLRHSYEVSYFDDVTGLRSAKPSDGEDVLLVAERH